jgi:hypothetical protein
LIGTNLTSRRPEDLIKIGISGEYQQLLESHKVNLIGALETRFGSIEKDFEAFFRKGVDTAELRKVRLCLKEMNSLSRKILEAYVARQLADCKKGDVNNNVNSVGETNVTGPEPEVRAA